MRGRLNSLLQSPEDEDEEQAKKSQQRGKLRQQVIPRIQRESMLLATDGLTVLIFCSL